MNITLLKKENVYCHHDDSDCEVLWSYMPVMSERHAWRIADSLGLSNWDQGQGGRFSQVWYDQYRKRLCHRSGWDI